MKQCFRNSPDNQQTGEPVAAASQGCCRASEQKARPNSSAFLHPTRQFPLCHLEMPRRCSAPHTLATAPLCKPQSFSWTSAVSSSPSFLLTALCYPCCTGSVMADDSPAPPEMKWQGQRPNTFWPGNATDESMVRSPSLAGILGHRAGRRPGGTNGSIISGAGVAASQASGSGMSHSP